MKDTNVLLLPFSYHCRRKESSVEKEAKENRSIATA